MISPSKSNITAQPVLLLSPPFRASLDKLRFVSVTSPVNPLPQSDVTENEIAGSLVSGFGAGCGPGKGESSCSIGTRGSPSKESPLMEKEYGALSAPPFSVGAPIKPNVNERPESSSELYPALLTV